MWTFRFSWVLSILFASAAYGYFEPGHVRYYPYRSQERMPIISIDLDPQHQIDASFRGAAREDRLQDMLTFLKQGADINSVSDRGRTALMFAARNCSVPIARTLLRLHASVNPKDTEGDTALVYATLESCLPIVKMLLKKSELKLSRRDDSGKTVFDYATDCASLDVDGPSAQILELLQHRENRYP